MRAVLVEGVEARAEDGEAELHEERTREQGAHLARPLGVQAKPAAGIDGEVILRGKAPPAHQQEEAGGGFSPVDTVLCPR